MSVGIMIFVLGTWVSSWLIYGMIHDYKDGKKNKHQHCLKHIKELEIELGIQEPEQSMEAMLDLHYIQQRKEQARRRMVIDDPPIITDEYGHQQLNCHIEPIEARSKSLTEPVRLFDRRTPREIMNDIREKNKTVPPMMVDRDIEGYIRR